jgi:hypothetical protein
VKRGAEIESAASSTHSTPNGGGAERCRLRRFDIVYLATRALPHDVLRTWPRMYSMTMSWRFQWKVSGNPRTAFGAAPRCWTRFADQHPGRRDAPRQRGRLSSFRRTELARAVSRLSCVVSRFEDGRVQRDQSLAPAEPPRPASAVRLADRTLDCARDCVTALRTCPPRRAHRPGARPHGPAPGHLPLGYKDGEYGAERVPSGAYLGDRDTFLFSSRRATAISTTPRTAPTPACSEDSFSGTVMWVVARVSAIGERHRAR